MNLNPKDNTENSFSMEKRHFHFSDKHIHKHKFLETGVFTKCLLLPILFYRITPEKKEN